MNSERFLRRDLASFRDLLWLNGLGDLTAKGVLLVDLTRANPRSDIDWPPSSPLIVTLADEYDAQAREEAIADLSEFLLQSRLETTATEARSYSRGMLDNHRGPVTLYAQLAAVLAGRDFTG